MNLKFKSTKEQLPKNGEFILYIKTDRSLYHADSPLPTFAQCEWQWNDGDGCSCCCEDDESSIDNIPSAYKYLDIIDGDGFVIWTNETNRGNPEVEHFWWMTQDEFDKVWKNSKH